MIAVGAWCPWAADLADTERAARCRELRALALVYLGPAHPLTIALGDAISDASALELARSALSLAPGAARRRLLASYAALLPAHDKPT